MSYPQSQNSSDKPFVWDKVVRLSHWSVAIAVLLNLFITEEGETAHEWLGYLAVAMVLLRLIWSVSKAQSPARFRDLLPTPRGLQEHWTALKKREPEQWQGHNAFGLLAIWAMWFCIIGLGATGYLSGTDWGIMNDVSDAHEVLAGLLQFVVVLHLVAIFATSWWLKKHLLKTMLK